MTARRESQRVQVRGCLSGVHQSRCGGAAFLLVMMTTGGNSISCQRHHAVGTMSEGGGRQASMTVQGATRTSTGPFDEWERRVDDWINVILLGGESERAPVRRFVTREVLREGGSRAFRLSDIWFDRACTGLSTPEIALMVTAGPRVIGMFIQHVRDDRVAPLAFHYPLSSFVDLETKMVGEVACYMIEAILRENLYFTRSGRLTYATPPDLSDMERRCLSLSQAASAYEAWFARCYDDTRKAVVCDPDDLPYVEWDYDLTAGPGYLNMIERRARDRK